MICRNKINNFFLMRTLIESPNILGAESHCNLLSRVALVSLGLCFLLITLVNPSSSIMGGLGIPDASLRAITT